MHTLTVSVAICDYHVVQEYKNCSKQEVNSINCKILVVVSKNHHSYQWWMIFIECYCPVLRIFILEI